MEIQAINGKNVKLSAGTITVKDEDGKTRGLVKNVRRWKDAPPRVQFDFSRLLRASGIWTAGKSDQVYIDGKNLYFLSKLQTEEHYKNPQVREAFKEEAEKHAALLRQIESAGVQVLHCYF